MNSGIKTTRPIGEGYIKLFFEDADTVKLNKKLHYFLTRGSKDIWAFSFPTGILRPLHKKLLREGYIISLEDLKTCAFVLDVKGLRMPDGKWLRFKEE